MTPRKPWSYGGEHCILITVHVSLPPTYLPLELALVKDLDDNDARVLDGDVKVFVPVRVQVALDDGSRVDLLTIDADNSERIGEAEDIALDEVVGGDDCNGKW
jgi:hypothetical protein